MSWQFITSCVDATGEDINAMTAAAVPVTYRTMLKHVGEAFIELQHQLGYDVRNKRETGLTMRRDWHVGYFKSTYQGRPCYYFRWSHIEHIFQEERISAGDPRAYKSDVVLAMSRRLGIPVTTLRLK